MAGRPAEGQVDMASIYRRGKTWWVSYRVGGRSISKSLNTSNGREAVEIKKQLEARKTNGLLPKPSITPIGPLIQSLCDFWRATRRHKGAENDIGRLRGVFGCCCVALGIRSHTPKQFRTSKRNVVEVSDFRSGRYLPVRKLEDLTSSGIAEYLHGRIARGEICGKTANHIRATLSGLFTYARKYHGYVCPETDYRNPIEGVERFPESLSPIVWLKDKDITQQLTALSGTPAVRALVAVYIYAGLRRSEALWLTVEDVDLEHLVLRIRAKTIDGEYWQPKTAKDRTVPISKKLRQELTDYLPLQKGVWFFSSPQGVRWNPDNFSDHLRELNKAAGLPWSCAEYRHTFGSHLAQNNVSLYKISELMGNSPEICRKHYAALMPQDMHEEVEF